MIFREALVTDIKLMHVVRIAVHENRLSNPDRITTKDYEEFLTQRGKGWLCEIDNNVVGFAIVDLKEKNTWALFVDPTHEGKGIGKALQQIMLDWYFNQTEEKIWLGTAPATRAEKFYESSGWTKTGIQSNGEVRFEMTFADWKKIRQ